MNPANLLLCAADLMDLRGHCNDGPGGERREVCALEAIALAAGIPRRTYLLSTRESREAVKALAQWLGVASPSHFDNCATVYGYNDRPDRTRAEVTAAMRGTAAVLKAQQTAQSVHYHMEAVCI